MIATARALGVSLLDRIGNTPLLALDRLTAHLPGVQILGKKIIKKTPTRCSTPPAATPASRTPCWARHWAFP
jgi:hypothetical protein